MKKNIDGLNEEYTVLKDTERQKSAGLEEATLIINDKRLSSSEKMSKLFQLFDSQSNKTSLKQDYTNDMMILCKGYLKCLSDIDDYKNSLELYAKEWDDLRRYCG